MATNLRLRLDAEEAVRAEAVRTGRSQQELIRAAVDQYLRLIPVPPPRTESETLLAAGIVLPARSAFRQLRELVSSPDGETSIDSLDRADRM